MTPMSFPAEFKQLSCSLTACWQRLSLHCPPISSKLLPFGEKNGIWHQPSSVMKALFFSLHHTERMWEAENPRPKRHIPSHTASQWPVSVFPWAVNTEKASLDVRLFDQLTHIWTDGQWAVNITLTHLGSLFYLTPRYVSQHLWCCRSGWYLA